jgi:hypothetical protein
MARTNPQGVTRTQVSDLFSRNKKAREIDRALTALVDAGRRLERGEMRTGGAGRPAVVWRPRLRRARRLSPHEHKGPQVSPWRPDGLQPRRCFCLNAIARLRSFGPLAALFPIRPER